MTNPSIPDQPPSVPPAFPGVLRPGGRAAAPVVPAPPPVTFTKPVTTPIPPGWRAMLPKDTMALKGVSADNFFVNVGTAGEERYVEPEEWVRYFWKEAQSVAKRTEMEQLVPYFSHCLCVKGNPTATEVLARGRLTDLFTDKEIHAFLTLLLNIGFDSVPTTGHDPVASAAHGLATHLHKVTYELAWRADSRELATIRSQGYKNRAEVTSIASDMNMDKPWHPFSAPAVSSRLWLRKGQTDNCLQTVVSVAERYTISLAYPKIGLTDALESLVADARVFSGTKVLPTAALLNSPFIGEVRFMGSDTPSLRMVTFSNICMVALDSWVFETGNWQQASGKARYPERAVKAVKPSNVLGQVKFLRIHHGPSDDHGFTAFPIPSDSTFLSESDFAGIFGAKKFFAYYQPARIAFDQTKVCRSIGSSIPSRAEWRRPACWCASS